MFGSKKKEEISIDMLAEYVDRLFGASMTGLEKRAKKIVEDINYNKKLLEDACNSFERSEKEPDTEDLFVSDTTYIKKEKEAYVRALRRILDEANWASENENIYARYADILSNLDVTLSSVIALNKKFKNVIAAYANALGGIKKAFSRIENLRNTLKEVLEERRGEYMRYKDISEHLSDLAKLIERLNMESRIIANMKNETFSYAGPTKLKKTRDEEEKFKNDFNEAERRLLGIKAQINDIVAPLSRIAKKHDHMSTEKEKISAYVERPTNTLINEGAFENFLKQVGELKKEVEENKIDTKNEGYLMGIFDSILSGRLRMLLDEYLRAERELSVAGENARSKAMELSHLEEEEKENRSRENEMMKREKDIEEASMLIQKRKQEIEAEINALFKKNAPISITGI